MKPGTTENVPRHALYNSAGGCFRIQGFDSGFETTDPKTLANPQKLAESKAAEINPRVRKDGNSARRAAAQEAQSYLDGVFAVWTADHSYAPSVPYLGFAASWGGEGFYQRWQETMARYAARLKGVAWVE